MRYVYIGPKHLYYLTLFIYVVGLFFMTFLLYKSMYSQYPELVYVIGALITGLILWIIFYINNFIHATIDTESSALIFGNVLFKNVVPLAAVKHVGKYLFYKKVVKIKIENRTFYYASDRLGTEEFFKQKNII